MIEKEKRRAGKIGGARRAEILPPERRRRSRKGLLRHAGAKESLGNLRANSSEIRIAYCSAERYANYHAGRYPASIGTITPPRPEQRCLVKLLDDCRLDFRQAECASLIIGDEAMSTASPELLREKSGGHLNLDMTRGPGPSAEVYMQRS